MTANQVASMLEKSNAYIDFSRRPTNEDAMIIAEYLDEYGFSPWDGSSIFDYIAKRFVIICDYACLISQKRGTQILTANRCGLAYATRVTAASFIKMIGDETKRHISVEDFNSILD